MTTFMTVHCNTQLDFRCIFRLLTIQHWSRCVMIFVVEWNTLTLSDMCIGIWQQGTVCKYFIVIAIGFTLSLLITMKTCVFMII